MRILGLDVGDKTIGVAVCDELGLTAQGVEVIRRSSPARDFARLAELVATYGVEAIVIGLPKNMNGTIGPRGEAVQGFAAEVEAAFPAVKVSLWDERLSTVAAERSLIAADVSRAKRRQVIDKMAAVFILQGYLDSLPPHKLP
jgi:putative Holliday junction resolvase